MSNTSTFSIMFYLRRDKAGKDGKIPIYLRVTIDGVRAQWAIKRKIDPKHWKSNGTLTSNTSENKEIVAYMNILRNKIYEIQKQCLVIDRPLTPEVAIQHLNGGTLRQTSHSLIEVFDLYIDNIYNLVGKQYSMATYTRYVTTKKHVLDYLKVGCRKTDIALHDLDYQFLTGLQTHLMTVNKCNNNSTMKYIKNVKAVVNYGVKNNWLDKDPFKAFICKLDRVDRQNLTMNEVEQIRNKKIDIERLRVIADVFLFACYTGLSYIDISNLMPENIAQGINNKPWIQISRQKTGVISHIPLIEKACEILDKYKDHPVREIKGRVFPVPSNQKVNAYLKEIASICEINRELTFHIARHTCATLLLELGVSMEAVSYILGHSKISTTQIYAKTREQKLVSEFTKMSNF